MAEDIKLYFNMESNDITFCNIIKYMSICIHIYIYIIIMSICIQLIHI